MTEQALYSLRWTCPGCHRAWIATPGVLAALRIDARVGLSAQDQLQCGRCHRSWQPWECGIDWQPQNEAARVELQEHA